MFYPVPEFTVVFKEKLSEIINGTPIEYHKNVESKYKLEVLGGKSGEPNAGIITESHKNQGYFLKDLNEKSQKALAERANASIRFMHTKPTGDISIYIETKEGQFNKFVCHADIKMGDKALVTHTSLATPVPFEEVEKARTQALKAQLAAGPAGPQAEREPEKLVRRTPDLDEGRLSKISEAQRQRDKDAHEGKTSQKQ